MSNSAEALPKNNEDWKRRASSACPMGIAQELNVHPDTARASTLTTTASPSTGSARCNAEDPSPVAFTVPSPANFVLEQFDGNTALHDAAAAEAANVTSADTLVERSKNRSRTPRKRFPEVLYAMLSSPLHTPIISWNDSGDGFIIHDPAKFTSTLLPEYYRATHFKSFVRQLYTYGFKHEPTRAAQATQATNRIGSASSKPIAYFHNDFRKGSFDMVKSMKRDDHQDCPEAQLSGESCSRRNILGSGNGESNSGADPLLTDSGNTSHAQVHIPSASPLGSQVDLPAPDAHSKGPYTLTSTTLHTALEHLGHLETAIRHLQNDKTGLSTLHQCLQLLEGQLCDALRAHSSDSSWRLADTGIVNETVRQGAGLSGITVLDLVPYDNSLALFTPSQYYFAEDVVLSQSLLQPLTRPADDLPSHNLI